MRSVIALVIVAVVHVNAMADLSPAPCTMANCSYHASRVSGNSRSGCDCMCRNQWVGVACGVCPSNFDKDADCGTCAPGFSNYPLCTNTNRCTLANCSYHASKVSGNKNSGCDCTCENMWVGATCGVCPDNFDKNADCGACAPGFLDYPLCTKACTIAQDCNNHATSVSGTVATGCTCACRNMWQGAQCQTCPSQYDASEDCGACAPGFVNYPLCTKNPAPACTIAQDCSDNAIQVSGTPATGCICTCRNMWQGAQCQTCPSQYNPALDCGACAPGYHGAFPVCVPSCTIARDCSGNAVAVSGSNATGCVCTCRNMWQGARCQTCPSQYAAAKDCGACAPGYQNYPECTKAHAGRRL